MTQEEIKQLIHEASETTKEYLRTKVDDKVELLIAHYVQASVKTILLEAIREALQEFLAKSLIDDIVAKVAKKVAAHEPKEAV